MRPCRDRGAGASFVRTRAHGDDRLNAASASPRTATLLGSLAREPCPRWQAGTTTSPLASRRSGRMRALHTQGRLYTRASDRPGAAIRQGRGALRIESRSFRNLSQSHATRPSRRWPLGSCSRGVSGAAPPAVSIPPPGLGAWPYVEPHAGTRIDVHVWRPRSPAAARTAAPPRISARTPRPLARLTRRRLRSGPADEEPSGRTNSDFPHAPVYRAWAGAHACAFACA